MNLGFDLLLLLGGNCMKGLDFVDDMSTASTSVKGCWFVSHLLIIIKLYRLKYYVWNLSSRLKLFQIFKYFLATLVCSESVYLLYCNESSLTCRSKDQFLQRRRWLDRRRQVFRGEPRESRWRRHQHDQGDGVPEKKWTLLSDLPLLPLFVDVLIGC